MADIVVKKGGGTVKTKLEIAGGAQAVTSSALWTLDGTQPDHFTQDRKVKKASDPEGALYDIGSDPDIDNRYLEWVWTAAPAPGGAATQATIRITVQQDGKDVDGYPLSKPFALNTAGPVTFSITRHIRVAP